MTKHLITTLLLALCTIAPCSAAVVYVAADAPGPTHNGTSWQTAFRTVNAALGSLAYGGDVWVKCGVYTECVALKTYVNLYGGFLGFETTASQRLPGAFPSTIDAQRKGRAIDILHSAWVTIDGITARNGLADRGAGIRCNTNSRPIIRNCRIENCEATECAGGVYFGTYTTNCELTDSVISGCSAPTGGGGVVEYHSYPTWRRNLIIRNHATISGGGLHCPFHSGALLENCTLAFNTAELNGGAVYAYYGGPVTLNRCIISNNQAPAGGGVYGDGGSSQAVFTYCDFHANAGGNYGGWVTEPAPSTGCFSANPMFIAPESDEYHLALGSPCANVGAFPLESVYKLSRIGIAKRQPSGAQVQLAGKVVSCVDGGLTYIQEPDRSAAICVQGLTGYQRGDVLASVAGSISGNTLTATSATLFARGIYQLKPLGTRIGWLASATGIHTKTWGTVESTSPTGFTIRDGDHHLTIRSTAPTPSIGSHVSVTGIYTTSGDYAASEWAITRP